MNLNTFKIIVISLIVIVISVSIFIINRENNKSMKIENALNDLSAPNAVNRLSVSEEQATLKNLSAPSSKSLISEVDKDQALKLLQN